jgi:two-component system chemotaxis response regulator CheB
MIRILIVDDSPTARLVLTRELEREPDFMVVGAAADAFEARQLILAGQPHVLTLDLQMPRMSGLDFLDKLMAHHPLPVVIVSSITPAGSETALAALRLGAVEVVGKAGLGSNPAAAGPLVAAIRAAGQARVRQSHAAVAPTRNNVAAPRSTGTVSRRGPARTAPDVIAIGGSTGGTRAIEDMLRRLPSDIPGVVIAQHLPAGFTRSFAARLNSVCAIAVREAQHGDIVAAGTALIAPGGCDTILVRVGDQLRVQIASRTGRMPALGPAPSVDSLFRSVAQACGPAAIGILLTGMGSDGAHGLSAMRQAGALTIAESEETCVVYGMPRAAVELGAVAVSVPLYNIPDLLFDVLFLTVAARIWQ